MVMPTPGEIKNGWTEETLTEYLEKHAEGDEERYEVQIRGPRKENGEFRHTWPRKTRTDNRYNPFRR